MIIERTGVSRRATEAGNDASLFLRHERTRQVLSFRGWHPESISDSKAAPCSAERVQPLASENRPRHRANPASEPKNVSIFENRKHQVGFIERVYD